MVSPKVAIIDFEIQTIKEITHLLDASISSKAPLVIICRWIADDPLAELVHNIKKQTVNVRARLT